jgi:hypothetical protein
VHGTGDWPAPPSHRTHDITFNLLLLLSTCRRCSARQCSEAERTSPREVLMQEHLHLSSLRSGSSCTNWSRAPRMRAGWARHSCLCRSRACAARTTSCPHTLTAASAGQPDKGAGGAARWAQRAWQQQHAHRVRGGSAGHAARRSRSDPR